MYEIEFFMKENGEEPAREFIDSRDMKMQAKILTKMELLEICGPTLKMPHSRPLGAKMFELRAESEGNLARLPYFFVIGKKVVITHGFQKKTEKTPQAEIEKAQRYMNEFLRREKDK